MTVEQRIKIEKAIAKLVISAMLKAQYKMRVFDGEEYVTEKTDSKADLLKAMFATDEETLTVYDNGKCIGQIQFVYGNDGYDVISDYSTSLEADLKPVFARIEKMEGA